MLGISAIPALDVKDMKNKKYYNQQATNKLYMLCSGFAIYEFAKKQENGEYLLLKNGLNNEPVFIKESDTIFSIAKLLIDQGADLRNSSCLIKLVSRYETEAAKLLIENKVDVNFQDMTVTSLAVASNNGDVEMVKFLLEHKANVNLQNGGGCTPLYFATKASKTEVIKILLEYKADINVSGKFDKNPLDITNEVKDRKVVCLFNQFLSNQGETNQSQMPLNGNMVDED